MSYNVSLNAENVLCVSGKIDLTNVKIACSMGKALIDTLPSVRVDLSGIEQADSSSLAMLVDWLRKARSQHKAVIFLSMPQCMLDLERVCGLDLILPVNKTIDFNN